MLSYTRFRRVYMTQPNRTLEEMEYASFTAVFLDASSRQFQHHYLKGGVYAGMNASLNLRAEVERFLHCTHLYNASTFLLIYVHGNLQEIAEGFQGKDAEQRQSAFYEFKRGFCTRLPGCETILADLDSKTPSGRRCADSLIKLTASDTRNAAVIMSGMPHEDCIRIRCDSGLDHNQQKRLRVAWFLDVFEDIGLRSQARSASDTTPAPKKEESTLHVKRYSLPDPGPDRLAEYRAAIRRPTGNAAAAISPNASPDVKKIRDPHVVETLRANRKANGKISTLRQAAQYTPAGPRAFVSERNCRAQVSSTQCPRQAVVRDQQGRRLDPVLKPRQDLLDHVEHWRLCNKYHLLSAGCSFPNCKHLHMVEDVQTGMLRDLTIDEQTALRKMARRSPCRNGPSCTDVECFAGHRCPNHVVKGQKKCSFPEAMHFAITEG